jgi:hypothetical protein
MLFRGRSKWMLFLPAGVVITAWLPIAVAMAAQAESELRAVNACDMLEVTEIGGILETSVTQGEHHDNGLEPGGAYSSTCLWRLETKTVGREQFVILNLMRWSGGSDDAKQFLQAFRDAAEDGVLPATPDERQMGDEALWWGDGLAVRVEEFSFGISVVADSAARQRIATPGRLEEELAKLIIKRLAN